MTDISAIGPKELMLPCLVMDNGWGQGIYGVYIFQFVNLIYFAYMVLLCTRHFNIALL